MLKYIFLGLVQGATEFFPVSSSGHLVIFQHLLGINENVVFLDVLLHLGSLCSLIVFFSNDIFILFTNFLTAMIEIIFHKRFFSVWRYDDKFKLCIYIILTTLITGSIALMGKEFFERQFESINTVIFGLFITGVILFLTKNFNFGQRRLRHILLKDSIVLGFFQSLAIIPGISRSGISISTLLFRNVDKESAFKLSFLMSIPIILAAFILKFKEVQVIERNIPLANLISGFLAAFISGLAALHILSLILKKQNFYKFSYYCFFLSLVVLLLKIKHIF